MRKVLFVALVSLPVLLMAQETVEASVSYADTLQADDGVMPSYGDSLQTATEGVQLNLDSLQMANDSLSGVLREAEEDQAYQKIWKRKKYWNIGYVWGGLKNLDLNDTFDSELAFSLSSGRVIYFHKKPIANMLRIGLEFGGDIKFAKYKEKERYADVGSAYDAEWMNAYGWYDDDERYDEEEDMHIGYYSLDMGVAIGPSVTFNPVGKLKVKAFFHVVPSYSMLIVDNDVHSSYKTTFTYGGEVTWGRLGIGLEGYTGTAKYKSLLDDVYNEIMDDDMEAGVYVPKGKTKFRTSGFSLYLTIKL